MKISDLTLFKEKFNTSDYFISVVNSLIDRLLELEYISDFNVSNYINNLFDNIQKLTIDSNRPYDYKTGFYDANKKELYIKDTKNIPATYLRLLYALTTTKIDSDSYNVGYATTKIDKKNCIPNHINFGINRAIISNLVYNICNLLPASLKIIQVEPSYTHNFLGFKIDSQNDMYYLEGKILSELCYVLDLDVELLYHGLFAKNPMKVLQNAFKKKKFTRADYFLNLFDDISRRYSTYNKLVFLCNKLKDNSNIENERDIIEHEIVSVLSKMETAKRSDSESPLDISSMQNNSDKFNYIDNLTAIIEHFEKELRDNIVLIQDILAEQLIESSKSLKYSQYASKLKCFNNILIEPSEKLNKKIEEIIICKLMQQTKGTNINTIQKIKYALIDEILSEKNYSDISNTFSFYNVIPLENESLGSCLIILHSSKSLFKVLEISGLKKNNHNYTIAPISLHNLKHLMTVNHSNIHIENTEELYSSIKNVFKQFSNLCMENIFVFEYGSQKLLLIISAGKPHIISFKSNQLNGSEELHLSKKYKVFGK